VTALERIEDLAAAIGRRWLRPLLAVVLCAASSCLGSAGFVAGPISGPISAIRHDQSCGAMVVAIPLGMWMGFLRGIQKDKDFFATGSYTTPGTLQISEVFYPVGNLKDPRVYPPEPTEEK
jgi:hypothetical protein